MVFQHFNLLQSRTVAGNVRFPMELAGQRSAAEMDARVDELLALVGLSELRDRHRPSPADRSSAWALPAPCADPEVLLAMKPPRRWTRRQQNRSWRCWVTSAAACG
jgi:ABC-type ATPase involved in cell division